MLLSQHQIAQTREYTLNNLLDLSSAYLDAGQRMSELLSAEGRATLTRSGRQMELLWRGEFDPLADSIRLMCNDKTQSSRFLEQLFEVIGSTHLAMIEAAGAQAQAFDEIVLASFTQASNYSPRETKIVVDAMANGLESAERAVHEMSDIAAQSSELAEQEIHQLSDSLADKSKKISKSPSRSRKKAEE